MTAAGAGCRLTRQCSRKLDRATGALEVDTTFKVPGAALAARRSLTRARAATSGREGPWSSISTCR
jgi:hypothetical protein